MREHSNRDTIDRFFKTLGALVTRPVSLYLTGGATAILLGLRDMTVDVDLTFIPETDEMFQALAMLKNSLNMNIELASPDHFIPKLPGADDRHIFIGIFGGVSIFHYDLYTQALSKIERGWDRDLEDALGFIRHGVDFKKLCQLFSECRETFLKYPAVDVDGLAIKLNKFGQTHGLLKS